MDKPKRKNDQPDPGCPLPLFIVGAVVFGSLFLYEIVLMVERGL